MNSTADRLADGAVVRPGAGRLIRLGPITVRVLEDGAGTSGALGLAEFEVPPGAPTPPPHAHGAHEEGFYVLAGELDFLVGGTRLRARPGAFLQVPRGVPHTFANPGPAPARFLNTFTPPRYLDYFAELSAVATSGRLDPEQGSALMARFDTAVVSPPGSGRPHSA
jgi:quercetin dioxygenase-like cupin family protein